MIVWERGGRWAAWSRLMLGELAEPLVEVRTLADCWQTFVAQPGQSVMIEFRPERSLSMLQAIYRLAMWGAGPKCLIAVGGPELGEARAVLHEAGVTFVATSPRQLTQVARLLDRYAQRLAEGGNQITRQGRRGET